MCLLNGQFSLKITHRIHIHTYIHIYSFSSTRWNTKEQCTILINTWSVLHIGCSVKQKKWTQYNRGRFYADMFNDTPCWRWMKVEKGWHNSVARKNHVAMFLDKCPLHGDTTLAFNSCEFTLGVIPIYINKIMHFELCLFVHVHSYIAIEYLRIEMQTNSYNFHKMIFVSTTLTKFLPMMLT